MKAILSGLPEGPAIVIAAIIGGLIAGYFMIRQAQIPVEAAQTAEAEKVIRASIDTPTPTETSISTNTPPSEAIPPTPTDTPTQSVAGNFIATQLLVINDVSYSIPTDINKKCIASEQTGNNTVQYNLRIPDGWVVVWDSWKAYWPDNKYENDGLLIIYGDWHSAVTIVNGQYCAVPIEWIDYALNDRRNAVSNPNRQEYFIGDITLNETSSPAPFVTTFEVFAAGFWQDTGVEVKEGDNLRIIWDGEGGWRGTNSGDFSDPLGGWIDPSANYACPPAVPSDQAGWNSLVAKIGENGIASNPFKTTPSGIGKLYLEMNDCDEQRGNNEGSIIVHIELTQ